MRLRLFVFFVFVLISAKTFSQEVESIDTARWLCTYKYELLQDSTSKNSLKQTQMILQIGLNTSKFCDFRSFLSDSFLYQNRNESLNEANFQSLSDQIIKITNGVSSNLLAMNTVYKNYPQKTKMLFIAYADHKYFKVVQPLQMNWKLDATKDTVILGYRSQRAYTSYAGRSYKAWYTTQIPISEGPYKFNGLPGLIVKIYDSKNQHRFTLTSVKKLKYVQPITLSKQNYIEITAQEYVNVLRNKINSLFGKVQSGDINIFSEEGKAKSMQGLKAKNNFIEKY